MKAKSSNYKRWIAWLYAFPITFISALGQSPFQNMNFENALVIFIDPGNQYVATTNALPGWSALAGTNALPTIAYNVFNVVPEVGLYGSNSYAISGSFGLLLRGEGTISQTGLVPSDAKSLFFKGDWNSSTALSVSLGGQSLPYTVISNTQDYTLYGADVSMFAGQTSPLTFLATSLSPYFIDDIQFSTQTIPEASTLALFSLGGSLFVTQLLFKGKKRGHRWPFS